MTSGDQVVEQVLAGPLADNPRMSAWLRFDTAGEVVVRSGRVELGQGITSAFAQLAADELDVDLARIVMVNTATDASPDEGYTAGSRSMEQGGAALRQVCAEARAVFLAAAGQRLGVAGDSITVADGEFCAPDGTSTTYWELASGVDLDADVSGRHPPRALGSGRYAGEPTPRLDLPAKVSGQGRYVHNLRLEGMLNARVIRPPSQWSRLADLSGPPADVTVVREGDFAAVLAEREEQAIAAAEALQASASWEEIAVPAMVGPHDLRGLTADTEVVTADLDGDPEGGELLSASYTRPFLAHASMGPSCAVAQWEDGRLTVWSSSQGVFRLRAEIARALDVDAERITVHHLEGAGCYGHNGADDVSYEAAVLARHAGGRPVRLQWTRAEELGWAPFGTAALVELAAAVDGDGHITGWSHEMWAAGFSSRPGRSTPAPSFAAAPHIDRNWTSPVAVMGGMTRNAEPLYRVGPRRIVAHRVHEVPVRTSSLRSLGAHPNVFAIESFLDELAARAGVDPVEFRLRHLDDVRARAVIERAAAEAEWERPRPDEHGRGIGFARYKNAAGYCAVVADVEATTHLAVKRLTIAVDAGFAVNPDGLANQIEGGAIQATSWTLLEQVAVDPSGVTSTSWGEYPILRFSQVPAVDVFIIHRPDQPPLGAGEIAQGPTSAAIANALYDAIGVRVRDLPLTQDRILAAL